MQEFSTINAGGLNFVFDTMKWNKSDLNSNAEEFSSTLALVENSVHPTTANSPQVVERNLLINENSTQPSLSLMSYNGAAPTSVQSSSQLLPYNDAASTSIQSSSQLLSNNVAASTSILSSSPLLSYNGVASTSAQSSSLQLPFYNGALDNVQLSQQPQPNLPLSISALRPVTSINIVR